MAVQVRLLFEVLNLKKYQILEDYKLDNYNLLRLDVKIKSLNKKII